MASSVASGVTPKMSYSVRSASIAVSGSCRWQPMHTRCGVLPQPNRTGSAMALSGAQPSQQTDPHARQWWRRRKRVNWTPQSMHLDASWSGVHRGGPKALAMWRRQADERIGHVSYEYEYMSVTSRSVTPESRAMWLRHVRVTDKIQSQSVKSGAGAAHRKPRLPVPVSSVF